MGKWEAKNCLVLSCYTSWQPFQHFDGLFCLIKEFKLMFKSNLTFCNKETSA